MPTELVNMMDVVDHDAPVARAAGMLRAGKVVVLPTETVYGAAGLLTDAGAVERLKAIRSGDRNKPLTIHLARPDDALTYIAAPGDFARRMMRKLWPGPVGLVFDVPAERRAEVAKSLGLPESALYVEGTITLRCPDHLVATDVLAGVPGPVVLTAAGSGQDAGQVARDLGDKVDLVLDAGPTRYSKPSTLVRVGGGNSYEIVRAGVYDERIIDKLLKTTILFVCSGNTCRSPMAEALARKIVAEKLKVPEEQLPDKGITIASAGAFAMPGSRATPQAVEAVKELGGDLTKHRSRPLTVELIHQADAIFAMGRGHLQAIQSLVPGASDKVQLLDPRGDIDDPIGGDVELYLSLARELNNLIGRRLEEKSIV